MSLPSGCFTGVFGDFEKCLVCLEGHYMNSSGSCVSEGRVVPPSSGVGIRVFIYLLFVQVLF